MKQLLFKVTLILIMVFAVTTTCEAQRYRHYRGYYRPYYSGYYYAPRVVYNVGGYYSAYPRTVVVERPVYSSTRTTTTVKTEDNPELKLDGVTIERESTNRLHVKGGKANVTLDTSKANLHVVTTKLGSITVQTTGDGSAKISVQHGDKIVGTYNL